MWVVGVGSGRLAIFVDEAAEDIDSFNAAGRGCVRRGGASHLERRLEVHGPVRPACVVVLYVCGKDALEMSAVPDQHPIQTFSPGGQHEPLRHRSPGASAVES